MNKSSNQFHLGYKSFIDNFPDHIANFDRDFKHLYINKAIENEIQMSASQVIGKSNRDLNIPGDEKALDELESKISFVFDTGSPTTYYTQHTFPDGTRYYFMKLIPGYFTESEEVVSVWAITREITALKEFEKELQTSERSLQQKNLELGQLNISLDRFFYMVSHDLRSPLANINAVIEILKKGNFEELPAFVQLLEKSTRRLGDILTGLTDLIEIKNTREITKEWSFAEILKLITIEFADPLEQIQGKISSDFSACPSIVYPKPYLDSLFRNMISNAIKYRSSDRNLHLSITAHQQNDDAVLIFQDNGKGIDLKSNQDLLFKPFYRVSQEQEGKGMGLHIVKSLLEKNDGSIKVDSQFDVGSSFICLLKPYATEP